MLPYVIYTRKYTYAAVGSVEKGDLDITSNPFFLQTSAQLVVMLKIQAERLRISVKGIRNSKFSKFIVCQ